VGLSDDGVKLTADGKRRLTAPAFDFGNPGAPVVRGKSRPQ
jgi:hypothetical protein